MHNSHKLRFGVVSLYCKCKVYIEIPSISIKYMLTGPNREHIY